MGVRGYALTRMVWSPRKTIVAGFAFGVACSGYETLMLDLKLCPLYWPYYGKAISPSLETRTPPDGSVFHPCGGGGAAGVDSWGWVLLVGNGSEPIILLVGCTGLVSASVDRMVPAVPATAAPSTGVLVVVRRGRVVWMLVPGDWLGGGGGYYGSKDRYHGAGTGDSGAISSAGDQ